MYMTDEANKRRRSKNAKTEAINGVIAQLGERLPCTQEVSGSIPLNSTIPCESSEIISEENNCLSSNQNALRCVVI